MTTANTEWTDAIVKVLRFEDSLRKAHEELEAIRSERNDFLEGLSETERGLLEKIGKLQSSIAHAEPKSIADDYWIKLKEADVTAPAPIASNIQKRPNSDRKKTPKGKGQEKPEEIERPLPVGPECVFPDPDLNGLIRYRNHMVMRDVLTFLINSKVPLCKHDFKKKFPKRSPSNVMRNLFILKKHRIVISLRLKHRRFYVANAIAAKALMKAWKSGGPLKSWELRLGSRELKGESFDTVSPFYGPGINKVLMGAKRPLYCSEVKFDFGDESDGVSSTMSKLFYGGLVSRRPIGLRRFQYWSLENRDVSYAMMLEYADTIKGLLSRPEMTRRALLDTLDVRFSNCCCDRTADMALQHLVKEEKIMIDKKSGLIVSV